MSYVCINCETFLSDPTDPCPECNHEGDDPYTGERHNTSCPCRYCTLQSEIILLDKESELEDSKLIHGQLSPERRDKLLHRSGC